MSLFSQAQLTQLRQRFGAQRQDGGTPRDVDRLAAQCAEQHAHAKWHNPFAMLTRWLEVADGPANTDLLVIETAYADAGQSLVTDWGERGDPDVARAALGEIFTLLEAPVSRQGADKLPPFQQPTGGRA